ncbi:Ig-like domain-containing protein [candidate division KSB1 bacterium]|nr:Ig-like domain-containing protein [candidate division KSB1 bacterium]
MQIKVYKVFIPIIIFLACAKQGFPPGGPVDKRPPNVIETEPKKDTTNVPVDTKIEILFSEPVEHQSCEESIFITPFPGEDIKYKWKGKKLIIQFPDKLAENRTYIITIGTGTRDRRNNAMKSSYSLAFSTGPELDVAAIDGHIYGDARVEGTQVWAYDLSENAQPNPSANFPLYITQAGDDGYYNLSHMAYGKYRLFAVQDRDVNNKYDAEYDLLGVASKDISLSLSNPDVTGLNFQIVLRDTTPPVLRSAAAEDRQHVNLRFSEILLPDSLSNTDNYFIHNSLDTLVTMEAYQDVQNPYIVHLTTEKQRADTSYTVDVSFARDLVGYQLERDTVTVQFKSSGVPDTLKPKFVTMQPPDSAKNVSLETDVHIFFSETMDKISVEKFFTFADTLGDTVKGEIKWPNGAHLIFMPEEKLKSETLYFINLPVDSVFDFFGNSLEDTLFEKRFLTVNPDTLSGISGSIRDEDSTAAGAFYLQAVPVQGPPKEIRVEEEGEFIFKDLFPGIYTIRVFRDSDNNYQYSYGEAFPFIPAERIYVYPDSIKIRSRWPDEGENIVFPK